MYTETPYGGKPWQVFARTATFVLWLLGLSFPPPTDSAVGLNPKRLKPA